MSRKNRAAPPQIKVSQLSPDPPVALSCLIRSRQGAGGGGVAAGWWRVSRHFWVPKTDRATEGMLSNDIGGSFWGPVKTWLATEIAKSMCPSKAGKSGCVWWRLQRMWWRPECQKRSKDNFKKDTPAPKGSDWLRPLWCFSNSPVVSLSNSPVVSLSNSPVVSLLFFSPHCRGS